jgi:hypothetical protein
MFHYKKIMAVSLMLALAGPVAALPVEPGFSGGSLPACDDCFSGAVAPGFNLNFFGTSYTSLFVSNNGYVTFNTGQGNFTPSGLGAAYAGQPIIAPFFGDVDTRSGLGATTWGGGTYAGRDAFGVNWLDTGVFSQNGSKRNSFQLILADRSDINAGDFDIYFNYDQIQWETGSASGGSNGLGGSSASVGFNAGQGGTPGTFFALTGSLVPGSFIDGGSRALTLFTNNNVPGQQLYEVRNGVIDTGVPEPAVWLTMIVGFGAVGISARHRRGQTRSVLS